jgi:hypothetical protein
MNRSPANRAARLAARCTLRRRAKQQTTIAHRRAGRKRFISHPAAPRQAANHHRAPPGGPKTLYLEQDVRRAYATASTSAVVMNRSPANRAARLAARCTLPRPRLGAGNFSGILRERCI